MIQNTVYKGLFWWVMANFLVSVKLLPPQID